MADLKQALAITLGVEQYWTTLDGGTYAGIVRKMHPDWQGWVIIDKYIRKLGRPLNYNEQVKDVHLQALIAQFYREEYWRKIKGDEIISQPIANMLFDWTVTSWDDGIKALQRILNVKADGILGKETLSALNSADATLVYKKLRQARIEFYSKGKAEFAAAWVDRVKDNFAEVA